MQCYPFQKFIGQAFKLFSAFIRRSISLYIST
jgi:hypothetical protein